MVLLLYLPWLVAIGYFAVYGFRERIDQPLNYNLMRKRLDTAAALGLGLGGVILLLMRLWPVGFVNTFICFALLVGVRWFARRRAIRRTFKAITSVPLESRKKTATRMTDYRIAEKDLV